MMFLVVEAYRANRYTIQPQHSSITMRGGRKIAYFRLLTFFFNQLFRCGIAVYARN
jgi:hypothetical protein